MTDPLSDLERALAQIEQQISALEAQADPAQSDTLSALKARHRALVARLTGNGAIAQDGSTAVGAGGLYIGGSLHHSTIHLSQASPAAPNIAAPSGGTAHQHWPDSLPPDLLARLRPALLKCGPFESRDELRALFVDARLAPWRHSLPDAPTSAARVEAFLSFLYEQEAEDGSRALLPFLQLLSERAHPGTACRAQMAALADEVAALAADG